MNPYVLGRSHEAWERIHAFKCRPTGISDRDLEDLIDVILETRTPNYGNSPTYVRWNDQVEMLRAEYDPLITAVLVLPVTMTRARLNKLQAIARSLREKHPLVVAR